MSPARFRWALNHVDINNRFFEIDVEPGLTPEHSIKELIFSVAPPQGVSLGSTLYTDHERWKVEWSAGLGGAMQGSLNRPFQYFVLMWHLYGKGWQKRTRKERLDLQMKEMEFNIWWAKPQDQFGDWSPSELADLAPGAYEMSGKGFVWVGKTSAEFHPLFERESINKDVRWYLVRGTTVSEAVGLQVRQATRINTQMLAGFAVALASRPSITAINGWDKIADAMGVETSRDEFPYPSHRHAFKAAVDQFSSHPDERRIQELAKKQAVTLGTLSPKK